ncbi:hypothetical protein [Ulvibacterium sp.]|uniref:hypothetical protein n=1 Tax=Ulvibacterium sp. TaxID=2665914 RepID=UPI003CC644A7
MQLKFFLRGLLGISIVALWSCNGGILKIEEQSIYTLIIDDVVRPVPPPPPPPLGEESTMSMPKEIIDSLERVSLEVAVAPFFNISKTNLNKQKIDLEYHSVIDLLFSKDTVHIISDEMIGLQKKHRVDVINEAELRDKKRLFEHFDQLIYLSNITFNAERNRAVVYVGWTREGRLAGGTLLYLLKREGKNWFIEDVRELSIS